MTAQDKIYIVIMLIIGVALVALNYKIFRQEVNPVLQWIKDHKQWTFAICGAVAVAVVAIVIKACTC